MSSRATPIALIVAVAAGGLFAVFRKDPGPVAATTSAAPAAEPERGTPPDPGLDDPHAPKLGPVDPNAQLPPNHPSVGTMDTPGMGMDVPPGHQMAAPHPDDDAAIGWKVPAGWTTAPNPSSMRLATYKIGGAAGEAEMSVMRAGGSVDANVERWVGQFKDAGKEARSTKTVKGLKVTVVDVSGTYMGGMSGAPGPHPGWSLLAAIAEGKGDPYFFKMTGPTATVKAARPAFDAMVDGFTAK